MRNPLLPKRHNYKRPITCLGLALLITSCAAQKIPEESIDVTPSGTSEETIVTEETTTPPPTPVTNKVPEPTQSPEESAVSTSQSLILQTESLLKSFNQGTEYAVVRAQLLQEGWVPVKAPELGDFGVEREAYDAGFIEVSGCAGTGLGQCRFDFEHPGEQQGLSITTYGGSELQFGDWTIYPAMAESDVTPTDSSAIAQESRSEIPTQFQGEWNMDLEGCGSSLSDGRLVIGPKTLQFYESSGTASEIMVTGDLVLTVTSEYFAEGDTFTETDAFQLSSDSAVLTHTQTDTVRYRCPS